MGGMTDEFSDMHAWRGLFHCTHLLREHWLFFPCDREAAVVYLDGFGVHHGYCREHAAEGELLARRGRWVREGEEMAA